MQFFFLLLFIFVLVVQKSFTLPACTSTTDIGKSGCSDNCNDLQVCVPLSNIGGTITYGYKGKPCPIDTYCTTSGFISKCVPRGDISGCSYTDIICTSDGVFPDPKNCSVYHKCLGGVDQRSVCPKGQLFNPDAQSCQVAGGVSCSRAADLGICTTATKTKVVIKDSCLFYSLCMSKTSQTNKYLPTLQRCPPGEYLASSSNCESMATMGSVPCKKSLQDSGICISTSPAPDPRQSRCSRNYISCIPDPTNSTLVKSQPAQCLKDQAFDGTTCIATVPSPATCNCDSDDIRIPIYENCIQYRDCQSNKIRTCPKSLVFNYRSGDCDFPWNAPLCTLNGTSTTSTVTTAAPLASITSATIATVITTVAPLASGTSATIATVTNAQTTTVATSMRTCEKSGRLPDPTDCRKYFICSKSEFGMWIKTSATCPSAQIFEQRRGICVWGYC